MVRFETSLGSFTLELDAAKAPVSVENFLAYVDDGFFDGLIFHICCFAAASGCRAGLSSMTLYD